MIKRISAIFIIMLAFHFLTIGTNASETYGFKTIPLSASEKELIWNAIDIKKYDYDSIEEHNNAIVSFDVSEDEQVILALENNILLLIDENNKVLNCFAFSDNGSYYVKWNGDNFLLMLVRGSIVVELTAEGQLVNIIETDTGNAENNELWRKAKQSEDSINNNTYIIRNKMGPLNLLSGSYSQLVKIDTAGKEYIIYDVNTEQLTQIFFIGVFVVAFVSAILLFIFKTGYKKRDQSRGGYVIDS